MAQLEGAVRSLEAKVIEKDTRLSELKLHLRRLEEDVAKRDIERDKDKDGLQIASTTIDQLKVVCTCSH